MLYKTSPSRKVFLIFNYTFLTVLSIIFLVPYWYLLSGSFTDSIALQQNGFSLIPSKFSLDAYTFIFRSDPYLLRAVLNSVTLTVVGTILTMIVSIMFAYPLSRKYLRGRKFFTLYMIFTMLFSGGLVPYALTVKKLLPPDMWSIIVPGLCAPYYVLLLRNFFASISDSLEEAARIDGASHFRVLLTIFLPLSTPVLATVILFCAVSLWNNWMGAMLFIDERNNYPIQYLIQQIMEQATSIFGGGGSDIVPTESVKYACVVLGSMPIIMVYPFLQKYFINGMMMGGIKE